MALLCVYSHCSQDVSHIMTLLSMLALLLLSRRPGACGLAQGAEEAWEARGATCSRAEQPKEGPAETLMEETN